jgi:Mce-associated membrane protein
MTEPPVGRADKNDDKAEAAGTARAKRRVNWSRVLAYGVLPGLALLLAMAAGFLKWQDSSIRDADIARIESVAAAKQTTVALYSFRPDTIEKDVEAARDRLTGGFRETYTQVTRDVLIPTAKERQVSAVAGVPAAASVSASENHAVVLVFVDQTVTGGTSPPADTVSSVRVTLDKVGGRWLISGFDTI